VARLSAFGSAVGSTMLTSVLIAGTSLATRPHHLWELRRKERTILNSVERSGFFVRPEWQTKDLKVIQGSTTKSREAPLLPMDESGTTRQMEDIGA